MRYKFLIIVVSLVAFSCPIFAQDAGWKRIVNPSFSFSVPKDFNKIGEINDDSIVEEYGSEGIQLKYEYGMYSNDFSDWPDAPVFERAKIGGRRVRIGTVKEEIKKGFPYSTFVFLRQDKWTALSMFAACRISAAEKKVLLELE